MEKRMSAGVDLDSTHYNIVKSAKWIPKGRPGSFANSGKFEFILTQKRETVCDIVLGKFDTEEEAKEFLNRLLTVTEVPDTVVYSDMCRCGAIASEFEFISTGDMVWKRHTICKLPAVYSVLSTLNQKALSYLPNDIDEFLNSL